MELRYAPRKCKYFCMGDCGLTEWRQSCHTTKNKCGRYFMSEMYLWIVVSFFALGLLLSVIFSNCPAHAYYDAAADYSHGAQSYEEFVLGAPSRAHEAPDFLTPRVIHFSDNIRQNSHTNAYEEGKSETRKVIIRENEMEIK